MGQVKGIIFGIMSIALMVGNMIAFKELRRVNPNFTFIEALLVRGFFQTVIQAL
jgi:hypothetical protein